MLALLCDKVGQAVSKDEIVSAGWPEREQGQTGDPEITQLIRRIRLRIEVDPGLPEFVATVRGFGYRFNQGTWRP